MTSATAEAAVGERTSGSGRLGDVWGGLAAMLVAFPSAIAFGVTIFTAVDPSLASMGALAGIIGAASLGIVAPLVGRNGGFITAPCAPAAAVMSGLAITLAQSKLPQNRILALLALTALLSALFQILYGTLRAGRLIKFIPYQVVSGYLSGVAVIIAVAQFPKFLGAPSGKHLWAAISEPQAWKWQGIVVGIVTMAAMVLTTRFTKKLPGVIVGLVSGVASYFLLAMAQPQMRLLEGNPLIIGPIKTTASFLGSIAARASSLLTISGSDIALIVGPALTLSVLLSIDTLKSGVVLDALTGSRHNSNRELIGQGSANLASFITGGVPGAGAMGPSLVNVTSGGRTLWSGVIEGSLALLGFLVLGKLIAWVPIGALAGILLVVAWRMFDFNMFRLLLLPSTRLDFVVIATVIIVAETIGLIQASAVGVMLAIFLFIRNQMNGSIILRKLDLTQTRSKRRRTAEEVAILDKNGSDALLVQLKDDLFFGTTDQLFTELEKDLSKRRFILLDFRRVQSMDYTAAHLFVQMQERLEPRGGHLLFSGMPSNLPSRQNIEHYMGQLGLVGGTSSIRIFDTRDGAIEWMENEILSAAGWVADETHEALDLSEIELLKHLEADNLQALANSIWDMTVAAGGKVFSAGDEGDEVFFVRRGRVHILLPLEGGKRHHLATIGSGEFFGEMAFLDSGIRSADAEAAVETDLYVMSRKMFDDAVRYHPGVAARLFEALADAIAQRLRTTDGELRALEER